MILHEYYTCDAMCAAPLIHFCLVSGYLPKIVSTLNSE